MIDKITNANCYLNGQNLIGKVESIDLPDIKQKMVDFKPLGLLSEVELPSGFEKMEAKIKWFCFYLKEFLQISNFTIINNLTIRGNIESYNSLGRMEQKGAIITLNGLMKQLPLGQYKQNEIVNLETLMTVYAVSLIIDNTPILVIDVFTNTFKVGPLDLLSVFKQNS